MMDFSLSRSRRSRGSNFWMDVPETSVQRARHQEGGPRSHLRDGEVDQAVAPDPGLPKRAVSDQAHAIANLTVMVSPPVRSAP
jgi:hypothetical protein